jgi:hypothetical protein
MGLHEIRKVCTTKEMVSKLKRLPTEGEKIFASYTSGKGLKTRICRELKSNGISYNGTRDFEQKILF